MNDQDKSRSDELPTTEGAKLRAFQFSIKKTLLFILIIAITASGWLYIRESTRQADRRQILDQPQENIEEADQTDDTHPLDPVLKLSLIHI